VRHPVIRCPKGPPRRLSKSLGLFDLGIEQHGRRGHPSGRARREIRAKSRNIPMFGKTMGKPYGKPWKFIENHGKPWESHMNYHSNIISSRKPRGEFPADVTWPDCWLVVGWVIDHDWHPTSSALRDTTVSGLTWRQWHGKQHHLPSQNQTWQLKILIWIGVHKKINYINISKWLQLMHGWCSIAMFN